MKPTPEQSRALEEDPDFVIAPQHGNSLETLCRSHPDGVPVSTAAKALGVTRPTLMTIQQNALQKIREEIEQELF